jgi:hypothetical protein
MSNDKVLGFCESYSGLSNWLDVYETETVRSIETLAAQGKIEKHTRASGVTVWHTTNRSFPRRP